MATMGESPRGVEDLWGTQLSPNKKQFKASLSLFPGRVIVRENDNTPCFFCFGFPT